MTSVNSPDRDQLDLVERDFIASAVIDAILEPYFKAPVISFPITPHSADVAVILLDGGRM